jgi:UPF0716 protein FxsA
MGLVILLLVLGLPIAEIAAFVEIGGEIGVLATLAWVFLAALAGMVVIRLQGLATALQLRVALARNELPARALFDGACVTIAGLLLLFPGFVSDAIAILLLLPPLRGLLFHLIARRISAHISVTRGGAPPPGGQGGGRGVVIDGEFSEAEPQRDDAPPRLPSQDGRQP